MQVPLPEGRRLHYGRYASRREAGSEPLNRRRGWVAETMGHELSIPIALLAGLVSFLSPCVLPLVPGYISMLSGATIEELRSGASPALMGRICAIRSPLWWVFPSCL